MNDVFKIPRTTFAWLIASVLSVILPHTARMPFWLTLLCACCIITRALIFQGRISHPGTRIKVIVVGMTLGAMALQYGQDVFSTDATVGVLVVGLTLKLLEMQSRREVLLVIFLCYFTIVAEYIYSQSILITLYTALSTVIITSALMSLNQTESAQRPARTMRTSATILAQGIPLMLVLFVMFPRITPLWSVPLQSAGGVTGLSDTMSPGDIGNLTRSAELVFKVQFESDPPPNAELYWQGLTLELFNGRQWLQSRGNRSTFQSLQPGDDVNEFWFREIDYIGNPVEYEVIMEPTFEDWIFTLKIPQMQGNDLYMRRDFQVRSRRNIGQRFSYSAVSYLNNRIDAEVSGRTLERNLELRSEGNEDSRAFASEMRAAAGSDQEYIQSILDYFREEEFFYSLSPALLGENSVDDFLFSTREGFCEHFASAFAYLMRAAGIPARIVTGYQGGEINPYDSTLIVRQYDAHAWTEVWLEGQGWIRVDPTAAVAPQRINLGSEFTFQEDASFLEDAGFSLLRLRGNLMLNDLRLRLETLDYAWSRWVLNYNQTRQLEFLSSLFGNMDGRKVIFILLSIMFASVALVALSVLRLPASKSLPPATRLYLAYCHTLADMGLGRYTGETPRNYYLRISQLRPQWAGEMKEITETYMDIAFRPQEESDWKQKHMKALRQKVRQFRLLK